MNLGKPCKYSINLVNVPAGLVVHLLRAVEDVDHHAEGATQIFCRFRFSGSGGTVRIATEANPHGLGQGQVALVCERRVHLSTSFC